MKRQSKQTMAVTGRSKPLTKKTRAENQRDCSMPPPDTPRWYTDGHPMEAISFPSSTGCLKVGHKCPLEKSLCLPHQERNHPRDNSCHLRGTLLCIINLSKQLSTSPTFPSYLLTPHPSPEAPKLLCLISSPHCIALC